MWSDLNLPPINLWTVPYLEIKSAKQRAVHKSKDVTANNERLVKFNKLFNNRALK
jgi:hypothetical protein